MESLNLLIAGNLAPIRTFAPAIESESEAIYGDRLLERFRMIKRYFEEKLPE